MNAYLFRTWSLTFTGLAGPVEPVETALASCFSNLMKSLDWRTSNSELYVNLLSDKWQGEVYKCSAWPHAGSGFE